MKKLKSIFKPLIVVGVFIGVGCVAFAKKSIMVFKIKPLYKHLVKFEDAKKKLYSVVFSPYRISNGMRPKCLPKASISLSELEYCHELIQQKRQRA